MSARFFVGLVVVVAALCAGIAVQQSFDAEKQSLGPRRERPTAAVFVGTPDEVRVAVQASDLFAWVEAKVTEQHEWIAAEERRLADEAERERLAQDAAARAAAVRRSVSSPTAVPSGDCGPVAAVVGWGTVMHESGGNPYATNGIYLGCAQIGTPWWNGACAGLDWRNVYDQAACARIVMQLQGPSAWAGTYAP